MVDFVTWDHLTSDQQKEFTLLQQPFVLALQASPINDGGDLPNLCRLKECDGIFFISGAGPEVASVLSKYRQVIQALFADAVRNLNR